MKENKVWNVCLPVKVSNVVLTYADSSSKDTLPVILYVKSFCGEDSTLIPVAMVIRALAPYQQLWRNCAPAPALSDLIDALLTDSTEWREHLSSPARFPL